jgi:hypothetical protein
MTSNAFRGVRGAPRPLRGYKTAWFLSHRIREAMREEDGGLLGWGGGTVERTRRSAMNGSPRRQGKKGRGYAHKTKGKKSEEERRAQEVLRRMLSTPPPKPERKPKKAKKPAK